MSGRTIYVNANELPFARREAARILAENWGIGDPFISREREAQIESDARALAERCFDHPEFLINLVRDIDAAGDHAAAQEIIAEVGASLEARRAGFRQAAEEA